jgi:signal recognition particle subunit SRP54
MASLDTRRPAAQEQLGARRADRRRHAADRRRPVAGEIAKRAMQAASSAATTWSCLIPPAAPYRRALMAEMAEIKKRAKPHEILLVADALTGQDAVNTRRASTSASASPASC